MTEQLYSYLYMRCSVCGDAFNLACHYYDHEEVGTKVEFTPAALQDWIEGHIESCDAWSDAFSKPHGHPPQFTLSHEDGTDP